MSVPIPRTIIGILLSPSPDNIERKNTANIITELLTHSCKLEAKASIKNDGLNSIETAFSILGEVTVESILEDKEVLESLGNYTKFIDRKKLNTLFNSTNR